MENNDHALLAEVMESIPEVRLTDAEIDELAKLDAAKHGRPHEL